MGQPTAQLLVAPNRYQAEEISPEYDLEAAKALLDEAGWMDTDGDGIRDKDGMPMEVLFQAFSQPRAPGNPGNCRRQPGIFGH